MFYDRFVKLCNDRGEYPTTVAEKIGVNRSAASRWAKGSSPRDITLLRLADYFGVTVAYLKGEEEQIEQNNNRAEKGDGNSSGLEAALEALRDQPGRRALLSATKNMTEAQVLRFADWLADITGGDKY